MKGLMVRALDNLRMGTGYYVIKGLGLRATLTPGRDRRLEIELNHVSSDLINHT